MRITKMLALFVFAFGWGASAQATLLIDNGDGTITDDDAGLMWLKDATLFQGESWADAKSWADSLTVGGFDDWRLPSALDSNGLPCEGFNCPDTEFGSLYYGALGNPAGSRINDGVFVLDPISTHGDWFWTATSSGPFYYYFRFETGEQSYRWGTNPLNAWAVRTITAEVPEPPVWLLMSLGLFAAGCLRGKTRRP